MPAQAYGRFMGRFSEPLADEFVAVAAVESGQSALDVGCGPGALTARLVDRLGVDAVCAVDPSPPFVQATGDRIPGLDVRVGVAESLPFEDGRFDAALAQLVVHFMADPAAGLREMARVTRPGGVVAACVWNHASSSGPLSLFWEAVRAVDPQEEGESDYAGVREGDLARIFAAAGLTDAKESVLTVQAPFASFEEWWEPYLLGVGPAGEYVRSLDEEGLARVRAECQSRVPEGAFEVAASSWCVAATV